ncbi:MAG: TIGR04222 domain-containing membrane protein, partial [Cyanobacteria bacterium K_Offshore_surface_m2_239]|nr:TIGR04222 domain-containing membrane protein [Cyanobacteria bacterium K_Offshore_surface_m2_239]
MTTTPPLKRLYTILDPQARDAVATRIRRWSFDPPDAPLTFAAKLARENGWSARQAARVIEEYRRFLLLAVTAGHPVCPADAVDQAWHQHLLDSRAYWEEFCPQVLGRALHHSPSKGSAEERRRLGEAYRRTLASYRATFGEEPPKDLWPAEEERFRPNQRWQRLETSRCWVLPQPRLRRPRGWARAPRGWMGGGLLALMGLALTGCGALAPTHSFHPLALTGPEFLLFYGVVCLCTVSLVKKLHEALATIAGKGLNGTPNLSVLEMAYLAGGERRVVKTAILRLVLEGKVKLGARGVCKLVKPVTVPKYRVEGRLHELLKGQPPRGVALQRRLAGERALFAPLRQSLEQQRLINKPSVVALGRVGAAVLMGAVWLLGVMRLQLGLAAGRPVGFLIVSLLLVTVAWVVCVGSPQRCTACGEGIRKGLSQAMERSSSGSPLGLETQLSVFAVLGWVSLDPYLTMSLGEAGIRTTRAVVTSDSGGASSDGGGGGGCGGGCGGCGGCG